MKRRPGRTGAEATSGGAPAELSPGRLRPRLARLVQAATRARDHAYAPYSGFRVGAAVLAESGRIHAGCNVENASYGATLCAERAAVAALVAAGDRQVCAVAVVTGVDPPAFPCGICRQVLHELGAGALVVLVGPAGHRLTSVTELLPEAFVLRGGRAPRGPGRAR